MDRQTVWTGAIPRSVDFLLAQQNTMVSLAKLGEAVFGTSTLVDGFTVTPTGPASLNVLLTPGTIWQIENLEATTWSQVAANTSVSILKQGIQFINGSTPLGVGQNATLGITPPGTVGFSQVFLVEVQYQDVDGGSTVLPYYNAANPQQPFSGPANAGTANNTVRYGGVAYQVKAGVAAATGSQTTPTADAGWTGIYTITVANGATTITSGNISVVSSAPFLATNGKLPQIPTGVLNGSWVGKDDTSGAANTIVVTLTPAATSYTKYMKVRAKIANQITGPVVINVNGLGNKSVVNFDGSTLYPGQLMAGTVAEFVYDGTNFQVVSSSTLTRVSLTQPLDIYVSPSGNDSTNTGLTVGSPFATIQHAFDVVQTHFNLAGQNVTIHLAAGTHTAGLTAYGPVLGQHDYPSILITGDTVTPSNVVVSVASGSCFNALNGARYDVTGVKFLAAAGGAIASVGRGSIIGFGTVEFGAVSGDHCQADQGGQVYTTDPTYKISGGAGGAHISVGVNASFYVKQNVTVTVTGTPAFGTAFCFCAYCGVVSAGPSGSGVMTFSGSATGTRSLVTGNGVVTCGGSATYFPGSVSGTVTNGGQYF